MSGGKLTDASILALAIPSGTNPQTGKPFALAKLSDGHSLYIILTPDGRRFWRLRLKGSDKSLGEYPGVTIEAARAKAAELRAASKPQPAPVAAAVAAAITQAPVNGHTPATVTFAEVVAHWLTFDDGKAQSPATLYKRRLCAGYLAALNPLPVATVTPAQVRVALERIAADNGVSIAHRAATYASNIFDHAQRFDVFHNPASRRKAWLPAVKVTHHEAVTDPDQFGLMMEAVDLWQSPFGPITSNAARFMMRTIARPGSIAGAQWSEMRDLDKPDAARWEIPAGRMKGGKRAHIVPLAPQAVAILLAQRAYRPQSPYCFPHRDRDHSSMNVANLRRVFQFLGYAPRDGAKDDTTPTRQTAHGARTCFSTLTRELGKGRWDDRLIEMCQAHADRNQVRAAYNRAERLDERRALMCWWADEIERLKTGYKV